MKIQQNHSKLIHQRLKLSQENITNICEEWKIKKLFLFGSILRDDFNENSDIDLLIQFNPDAKQGLLTLARLKHHLEDMTQRSVDVVVQESVENSENWIRKQEILNTAQVIYCQHNVKTVGWANHKLM
ncbi:MAG: nucleotidyltransferase domain-containing protein [Crocosphaera sp.]|nr:nucleotidyltransferase domain-containing protein [Crocosphaera sp.]